MDKTIEIWKDVNHPVFKDFYQVSNLGRLKSKPRIVTRGGENNRYSYITNPRIINSFRCGKHPHLFTSLYSDVDGFNTLNNYFTQEAQVGEFADADFDFVTSPQYSEWIEADLTEYDPLHSRTVFTNGDWEGIYVEPTGGRPLSGFLERDLRVKSIIPVPAPVWDASIYKYAPLCSQGPESYAEDQNNFKVGYAYFAADLAAAEDGFFDQGQDVAWREPLVENQSLYILN